MKNLRKILAVLFVFTSIVYSASAAGKRIAVFNSSAEALSVDEKSWLPSSVRRRFEANFNDYTDFQLIEIQNETEIKNLQKKAESSAYDQNSSIALGKLVSAEYALFSTITKAGGKYILSANVTNLTTGLRLSSVTIDGVTDCTKLFEGAGSSVNKSTVKICSDLGVILSAVDKYILLKGDNLSEDEEIRMTKQELESYNKRKSELDKQLKEISLSSELDSASKKAKLEAERIMLEQQEKIAKDKIARLEKAREQLAQDQIEQQKRSDEQRKRIAEVAAETEKKAEELRNKKMETLPVDAQIAVIEAKKQALLEIRNNVKSQRDIIIAMAQEEYEEECAKIDAEPLRKGELDSNGKMLNEVKQRRENKKKKLKTEIEDRAKKDIAALKKTTEEQEAALLNAIEADRAILKNRRTISSLTDDRISFIGNYAGEKYEWDATASFYISDVCIFTKKVPLSYQTVTNKAPVKASDLDNKLYDDYLDTVDLYDYMFRRKVPVVSLELDYYVEALDDNRPSEYRIVVTEARYMDTKYNKPIMKCDLGQKNFYFIVNPAVDIRTEAEKNLKLDNSGKSNKTKGTDSNSDYQSGKNSNKSGSKTKSTEPKTNTLNKNADDKGRSILGAFIEYPPNQYINGYVLFAFPFNSTTFAQFDFGMIHIPEKVDCYNACIGWNSRLHWGSFYRPDVYLSVGAGLCDVTISDKSFDDALFTCKVTAGIDFPIFDIVSISFEYLGRYIYSYGWTNSFMVGQSFIFDWL
ncbi:MAG: hypothetical protein K6A43_10820 [Treponema sp.]|nr:hypothetical protein [Treponema sp.]